jgi:DNA-binding protein YbaB
MGPVAVTDQVDLGLAGFERLIADTRRALQEMRAGPTEAADAPEIRGAGVAADGQVRVTARTGGRLESVQLDPRALRLGSQALGEQILLAVNAALDDLQAQAGTQARAPAADPAPLTERMRELQEASVRQMYVFSQSITDAVERISRSAGARAADPGEATS